MLVLVLVELELQGAQGLWEPWHLVDTVDTVLELLELLELLAQLPASRDLGEPTPVCPSDSEALDRS